MDHYQTRGRGRQGVGFVHETRKSVLDTAQSGVSQNSAGVVRSDLAIPSSSLKRLQRLRRRRRAKGLSARMRRPASGKGKTDSFF